MGCASQSRSWRHRCRCRNPRLLHIFFFSEWGVFVSRKSSAENLGHFPLFPSHAPFLPVASEEGMIQKKALCSFSWCVFFLGPTQKNPQTKKAHIPAAVFQRLEIRSSFFVQPKIFPWFFQSDTLRRLWRPSWPRSCFWVDKNRLKEV